MKLKNINIDLSQPQVMAILNVTPDSFYSGSRTFTHAEIEARVKCIVSEGASIIDVGGYSSRPGAEDVSIDEEWSRVESALEIIRRVAPDATISIDTFRSTIIQRAVESYGSVIVNDISAGELDPNMVDLVAKYNLPYIAMHMKGTPQTMQQFAEYDNIVDEVVDYFTKRVQYLEESGVSQIIIDPGFGFAKTVDQNYALMAGIDRLCKLGYPLLSGVSRKSMIYKLLETDADRALTGTIALNWESLRGGASILRVHDVREAMEVVKIFNKLKVSGL